MILKLIFRLSKLKFCSSVQHKLKMKVKVKEVLNFDLSETRLQSALGHGVSHLKIFVESQQTFTGHIAWTTLTYRTISENIKR